MNKITTVTFGLLLIIANNIQSFAQAAKNGQKELEELAYPSENPDWIKFRPYVNIDPLKLFADHKIAFGLAEQDEMQLVNQDADEIGYTHYYYNQYYHGIKVEGSDFLVHAQNGLLKAVNGKIATGLQLTPSFIISEKEALTSALTDINASEYKWDNPVMEQRLRDEKKDQNASYFPKGEKVFVNKNKEDRSAENYLSAYAFDIYTSVPFGGWRIYVDANTGEIIRKLLLVADCNSTTVATTFYGNRTVWTSFASSTYNLKDDCTPTTISVFGPGSSTPYSNANNTWTGNELQSAATSLWGVRRTIDYYNTFHNRNGYDGSGGAIDIHQGFNFGGLNPYSNANFSNGTLNVGWNQNNSNTPNDDWNSIDIIGHEVTHGVTANNGHGGLTYQNESGALNESFSDILGKSVEAWASPATFDWLEGSQRGAIRSLSNPNSFMNSINGVSTVMPDTYNGTGWYSGTSWDFGGVHHNSSVQNFMFYLLVTGGSGTNDNGSAYSVTGIGMAEARTIAYYTLTHNLTSGSNYSDARKAWIQATEFLYGACSNEAIQTGNAWYAVGVGSESPGYSPNICGAFAGHDFKAIQTLNISNGCTISALTSTYENLSAGEAVIFYPGFEAPAGSTLTAFIDACDMTIYRGSKPEANNNNETDGRADKNSEIKVYPNPFSNNLTVEFYLPKDDSPIIKLFDMMGKELKTISNSYFTEGKHDITIDASDLPAGIYFVILQSSDFRKEQKVIKTN